MKVLFITRKYPPQIGGMEKYSKGLIDNINCQKRIIALKKSQWHLVWFIPYSIIRGFFMAKDCDLIYFCDSFMALAAAILKRLTKKPVLITAHGLDVTYSNPLYQFLIIKHLKYLDKIICVSNSTIDECVKRNVPREKCLFIPNGINFSKDKVLHSLLSSRNSYLKIKSGYKKFLIKHCNKQMKKRKVLVTVGRLIKRKGVAWFVKNVMPHIDDSIDYLVVGSGNDESRIKSLIKNQKLENRVFMLGRLSDSDLQKVCYASDLFIMPNIKIKNDLEGFGIVAIEASNWGLPVIASNIEGIRDAIKEDRNGVLVETINTKLFIKHINKFLNDPDRARFFAKNSLEYNIRHYSWDRICGKYLSVFEEIVKIK